MKTTKVFKSGNSQAVRIPKEFQVDETEMMIEKRGNVITLTPVSQAKRWESLREVLGKFSDDFMEDGREQPTEYEEREPF